MATPAPPGNQMTNASFCWDGTTTQTIGMDHGIPSMYHVLYHFKPDGTWEEFTLVVPTTTDPFNFVVNYGTDPDAVGLYVTYVYTHANYLLVTGSNNLGLVTSLGTRQNGQVWIFSQPADKTLGYKGTLNSDYTISGSQAVYCSGSAGVTLASSESSNFSAYVPLGIIPVDNWVVKYDLYKDNVNQNDPKTGDGNDLTWSAINAAPNTYTVKATRGDCSDKLMTGSPTVNDQARVKNNNTSLCFLTIQEGIDNVTTVAGNKLYCLLDEAYVEDLTVNKEVSIEPDPAQITANSWYLCEVVGKIDIMANNVSILNFFGVGNVDLPFPTLTYAIKVFSPYSNYLIDKIMGINADVHGIWVEGGAGAGTISNSTIGTPSTGIFANGQLTGILTISNNTIEGQGTGETGIQCNTDNAVIDGNTFNDNTPSVITTGNNVTIINNNFSNTTSGGVAINVTGTGVKIHYNNFSYSAPLTNLTAITSSNLATSVVDAIHNWYGDPTGPTIVSNPCGLGSNVVGDAVNYSPWYFDGTMVKLNGLPAIGLNDITDYSTITKTPLIIKATVTYPDTVSNYKSDVKNDCRITSTVNFPAGSRVAALKIFEGSSVVPYYTLPSPYSLPNDNKVYLSEIMGGYVYSLHSLNNNILHFEMTLDGFDAPWTSTITYDVVSYLNTKTNCNTVLNSDNFGLTFDNSALTITTTTPQQTEVCTGVNPLKFFANITYPTILNVDNTIKADAKITSAEVIPFGTEIKWSYNGSAPVSYIVDNPSGISSIYLSQIVAGNGNPAVQLPLQGNSGTDVWTFEIPSDAALETDHNLTIDAIAVLNTDEYVHNTANQTLTVHPLPTATLSIEDTYPTHICEGTDAHFKVVLTGTGPWAVTVQDSTSAGTHTEVLNVASSPYYFQRAHVVNTSWRITNVDDAHCSNYGDGKVRILIGIVTTIGQPFYYNRIVPGDPGATPPTLPEYYDSRPITNLCEGNEDVYIPILVQNYEDVRAVSLSMTYDQNVLTYSEYLTKYRSVMSNLNVDGNTAGVIKAGGYEGNGQVIPGTDTLFVVRFTYNGGNSAMKFDTLNPVACEYLSYSSPIEPFCDTPNKFYYHNMGPDLTGHIRPKAAVSGTSTICAGTGGSFTVTLTGSQPWTFKYSDGNTEHTESNITSSPHTVNVNPGVTTTYTPTFVSDANGCSFWNADLTGSATITVKSLPTATPTVYKISCNGLTNGSIDLSVSGGTPTYSYSWTGPSFTSSLKDISGLAKGTYNVTVTDNAGCVATTSGTINEPDALSASLAHTNVTCNGANDGTITISNVSGGWGLYEYSFDGGTTWGSSLTATGLTPANYSVKLRDKDYTTCTKTLDEALAITQPDALNATVLPTEISCNGAGDGKIAVSDPLGGYGTWEVSIDNFTTSTEITTGPTGGHTFTSLLPGTYDIKIRDKAHSACLITVTTVILYDPVVLNATVSSTVINCNNAADGTITIKDPSGGYGTWEASINDFTTSFDIAAGPAGSHTFTALAPATYTVKMRDKTHTSCIKTFTPITLSNPDALTGTKAYTDITCNTLTDGTITVSAPAGGYGTYEASIDDFATAFTFSGANSYTFTALGPNTYTVKMRDAAHTGCTKNLGDVVLTDPAALNATVAHTVITCHDAGDGTITVSAPTGGYGTYEVSIDGFSSAFDVTAGTPKVFSGLGYALSPYTVKIRDKAKSTCVKDLETITLTNPNDLDATVTSTVITCHDAANGTITVSNPTGGASTTYEITTDDFTTTHTLAPSGTYTYTQIGVSTLTVKIRDKEFTSCIKSFTPISFSNPDVLNASSSTQDISCHGASDGSFAAYDPIGGWGTYEVSIDDFATAYTITTGGIPNGHTFTNLAPGTYYGKIRDKAHTSCVVEYWSYTFTDPAALDATVASTVINCNGAHDGTITVSAPVGGRGTWEATIDDFTNAYEITTGPTGGHTFSGLYPGTYTVKLRDKANATCIKTFAPDITLTDPPALGGSELHENITCYGESTGSITISPSGGWGTYQYTKNGGTSWEDNGGSYTGLAAGTYNVAIRDKAHTGCVYTINGTLQITQLGELGGSVAKTEMSCHSTNDATITVSSPAGGSGTYEYSIASGTWQSSGTFTAIGPGSYDVYIRDAAHTGCTKFLATKVIVAPDAISVGGIVKYYNPTAPSPYTPLSDVTVKLYTGTTLVNSATVTASGPDKGKYSFSDVCPGTYTLTAERTLALDQNPVNATDAALVAQWSTDQTLIERVKFDAADVMGPQNTVNSIDARRIMLYFTSSGTNTWEVNPGTTWNFWTPLTTVNNPSPGGDMSVTVSKVIGNITNEDLYGLFRGDFNSSWHPSAKSASENMRLNLTQTKSVEPGTEFELPIYVTSNVNIKAMSMILNFPSDKLEITGAYLTGDPGTEVLYNLNGEELRLAWTSLDAVNIPANGRLMTLKLKLTQALAQDEFIQLSLVGNPLNELADASVNVIPNVELYSAKISSGSIGIGNATGATMEFANYPNPFNETTTFVYTTPVDGKVTISVYDMLGKQVNVFVNENMVAGDHKLVINSNTLKPGVYTATLILDSNGQVMKRTIKIIRNQ